MRQYDAIIIGAGQAGPTLTSRLAASGQSTAIIGRSHFGGTCVNYGCIPTKTMVASARVAHMARWAPEYGVIPAGPIRMDNGMVKNIKRIGV